MKPVADADDGRVLLQHLLTPAVDSVGHPAAIEVAFVVVAAVVDGQSPVHCCEEVFEDSVGSGCVAFDGHPLGDGDGGGLFCEK